MTYSVVAGQESHPVLAGIPSPFTFFADGHDAGSLVVFGTDPSTVLMRSPGLGPAVTVREFENGRVVSFSHAANFGLQGDTLQDSNIQKLYINAVDYCSARDLYVGGFGSNNVIHYSGNTGAFIEVLVPSGSGGLGKPLDIVFGPDGNLYVASDTVNAVLRYDRTTGAFIDTFVTAGSGGLVSPIGLTFGPRQIAFCDVTVNTQNMDFGEGDPGDTLVGFFELINTGTVTSQLSITGDGWRDGGTTIQIDDAQTQFSTTATFPGTPFNSALQPLGPLEPNASTADLMRVDMQTLIALNNPFGGSLTLDITFTQTQCGT